MIRSDFSQFGKIIPLFAVDSKGEAVQIATVYPQADGGFRVVPKGMGTYQKFCAAKSG